ncbi:Zn-dependent alcohol dehydrogenase [Peribacillus cavernae]|uniref:Zn-dependent alcohol dehydrogenase n=1 Tax=Peribacillus cavernae TaxID=1674310 RepID=A0A433HWN2_9BACI|nr:alcohol dehydrogenase catalytic domain-containing protein [Peribacillus cavernae]MDQ0218153.1 2-desacetyl-2-hydroxyethyl bacteriochlorophyllide A dehydrogenase [Peribacillus cavernae]RUQ32697.1 Zn-dependent alcohol dehydrogenase [Peribacillus cavernae]
MRAAFYEGNEKIRVGESVPVPPKAGEVQIKVSHAGICGTDLHIFHGHMDKRVTFPQIMGHEMSGTIHAVGEGVINYSVGDRVTVMPLDPCGKCPACLAGHNHICQCLKFLGIETSGAFQSIWTVPAHTLHRLPDQLSLEHGALVEPLAVACHDIRIGEVKRGESVVVIGSGPIGMLIALVAKEAGAKVLIVEINAYRLQLARQLGFDALNPIEEDIVKYVAQYTGGAGADVVFEVTSSAAGAEMMTQLPRTRGRIVVVSIFNQLPKVDLHRIFWRELKMAGARVYEHEDFEKAIQLAASGQLPLDSLVTEIYPLERLEEGFRQMESGGKIMKILLSCS